MNFHSAGSGGLYKPGGMPMAESVNEYHEIPGKYENNNNPTESDDTQPLDSSSPDPIKPDQSRLSSQQVPNPVLLPKVDNSSFERMLEHELFGDKLNPANDVGSGTPPPQDTAVVQNSTPVQDRAPIQTPPDNPPEWVTPKIEPSYYDLIMENPEDQAAAGTQNLDHDLVDVLVKNLNEREQYSAPRLEQNSDFNQFTDPSTGVYHEQFAPPRGVWNGRAVFVLSVIAILLLATGMFIKNYGISGVFDGITRVAQAANLVQPPSGNLSAEKAGSGPLLASRGGESGKVHVTDFVSAPQPAAMTVEKTKKIFVDRLPSATPDQKSGDARALKIKGLNVRLKAVKTLLSSLQNGYTNASPEKQPALMEEVIKAQSVISALKDEIAVLSPDRKIALAANGQAATSQMATAPTASVQPAAEAGKPQGPDDTKAIKTTVRDAIEVVPENNSPVIDRPTPLPVIPKPRDPATVELAMASTPGLYRLERIARDRLKTKLVNGDCLVPALSSVFPQVPVLVMRDMVRQLDDQC